MSETQQATCVHVNESKQRTALLTPPFLDPALLSRLTVDEGSLPQLDPLSSLELCPSLQQSCLLQQPAGYSADWLPVLQEPLGLRDTLGATLYEPRQRSTQKPDKDPRGEDFYANVGYAIRTLREELPTVFQEDLSCTL